MHLQNTNIAILLAAMATSTLAQTPAFGISISDRGTAEAGGTKGTGCIPSCEYSITDIMGCTGNQELATSCDMQLFSSDLNCQPPTAIEMCGGYLDVTPACDGRLPGLQLRGAGSTGFDDRVEYQWTVGSCEVPSEGGTQCAPNTGCSVQEGHPAS